MNPIHYWVRKHPTPDTLYTALVNLPAGANQAEWEHMTEAELEAWKSAELNAGWVPIAPQPLGPVVRSQDTDTILQRLTEAERAALFTARRSVWQLDYMMTRAASTGRISEADPDFPAGRSTLDQLGIIASSRWDALFAD